MRSPPPRTPYYSGAEEGRAGSTIPSGLYQPRLVGWAVGPGGQCQHRWDPFPDEPASFTNAPPAPAARQLRTRPLIAAQLSVWNKNKNLLKSTALPRNVFMMHMHTLACSSLPRRARELEGLSKALHPAL